MDADYLHRLLALVLLALVLAFCAGCGTTWWGDAERYRRISVDPEATGPLEVTTVSPWGTHVTVRVPPGGRMEAGPDLTDFYSEGGD